MNHLNLLLKREYLEGQKGAKRKTKRNLKSKESIQQEVKPRHAQNYPITKNLRIPKKSLYFYELSTIMSNPTLNTMILYKCSTQKYT